VMTADYLFGRYHFFPVYPRGAVRNRRAISKNNTNISDDHTAKPRMEKISSGTGS
jgi:hypothetical protein